VSAVSVRIMLLNIVYFSCH